MRSHRKRNIYFSYLSHDIYAELLIRNLQTKLSKIAICNFTLTIDSLKESSKGLRNVTHALYIYHYCVQNEHTNVDLEIQVEVTFSL